MPRFPSLAETAALLAEQKITSTELVESCLAQIDRYEKDVQAWVFVDRAGARDQAARCDALARSGQALGPLHGIPCGVKDIINVAAWPTLAGSPLRKNHIADRDAWCVAQLRAAGAIVLGKTVTTQFASFDPSKTRNPWNVSRSPGGSSSGSAAAVAAGMCLFALGSQTGGSITRPAAYCGVSALKPTFGRLSLAGVVPLASSLDHLGVIAPRVADLFTVWRVLGHEPIVEPPSAALANEMSPPPRLGLLDAWIENANLLGPEMLAAFPTAMAGLEARGASLLRFPPLSISCENILAHHRRVMAVEAAKFHDSDFSLHKGEFLPNITRLIEEGRSCLAGDYAASLQAQRAFRQEIACCFDDCDALITPAATSLAPPDLSSTGNPACNSPWSFAGLPTISFPAGLIDGMPWGMQLIGAAGKEVDLFQTALWCERSFPPAQGMPAGLRDRSPGATP